MAVDPNLAGDTCDYLEAMVGDQGQNKASNPQWWLSTDIWVSLNPDPDPNLPYAAIPGPFVVGTNYNINVRVHQIEAGSSVASNPPCQRLNPQNAVTVEAWVCLPGAAIPLNPTQAKQINPDTNNSVPFGAGTQTIHVPWSPSSNPNDPDGVSTNPAIGGHKCIIARCYQDPDRVPSKLSFFVPDDPHSAQRNITIIAASPSPGPHEGGFRFQMVTANTNQNTAQPVTIRAVADLAPKEAVLNVVLPLLKQNPAFKRIVSTVRPKLFNLNLPDFPHATVHDKTDPFGSGLLGFLRYLLWLILSLIAALFGRKLQLPSPAYEADIVLQPKQITNVILNADSSKDQIGDARVYHITQVGADGKVQGGITVVTLAV